MMSPAGGTVLVFAAAAFIGAVAPSVAQTKVPTQQFNATPAPIYATGFGETSGYPYRDETLIIFRTYEKQSTTLHFRNIGTHPLRIDVSFDCPNDALCPLRTTMTVPAVQLKTDASQERIYRTNGSAAYPFHWELRLADSAPQSQNVAATAAVSSHGETSNFVPVGDAQVKFFIQRDRHSTGIYVRNVGRRRIHVMIHPHCAAGELCPVLADAVVPPVVDPRDGRNDYIYTVETLDKSFNFDWTVWILDDQTKP